MSLWTIAFAVVLSGCGAAQKPAPAEPSPPSQQSASPSRKPKASAKPAPKQPADGPYYAASKARLEKEGVGAIESIDMERFRRALLLTIHAEGVADNANDALSMHKAFEARNYAEVVEAADRVLARNYADAGAHLAKGLALVHTKGRDDPATKFHMHTGKALVDSILDSGDGRSPESAIRVYQVKEEYDLFLVLGLAPEGQALIGDHGRHYDKMSLVRREDGKTLTLFFDITEMLSVQAAALGEK